MMRRASKQGVNERRVANQLNRLRKMMGCCDACYEFVREEQPGQCLSPSSTCKQVFDPWLFGWGVEGAWVALVAAGCGWCVSRGAGRGGECLGWFPRQKREQGIYHGLYQPQ
jgi:hypothetical protein